MKWIRPLVVLMLFASVMAVTAEQSEAGIFRRSRSRYSFGGARPVTGFGANIHRRAILKQESQRAARGLPVRFRGNIRWSR